MHGTPLPLYAAVHILDELRTNLMDSLFINQKQIRTFKYRIHWNINIRKKHIYEKIKSGLGWNKQSGEKY